MQTNNRRGSNPFRTAVPVGGQDTLYWFDETDLERSSPANKSATKLKLETARLSRQSPKYPGRLHYEGRYWFAQLGESIFHDSMVEFAALMTLDHEVPVRAIAAQPMCIVFADGSRHYPDYFAVMPSGEQVLFDVKPPSRVSEKVAMQFAKTREVCRRIGWRYEILPGLERTPYFNLEWISGYRYGWAKGTPDQEQLVLDLVANGNSFGHVHRALGTQAGALVHVIYSLMWNRRISFRRDVPLSEHTRLEVNLDV